MSARNSLLETIQQIALSNPFWWLVSAVAYRQTLRSWVRLFRRQAPRLNTTITPGKGSLVISAAPEPMPPGTASAIVTAMQPPPQRPLHPFGFGPDRLSPPNFVNNSNWMQWEAAQRHHDVASRAAMQSTMPRFVNTLN